MMTAAAVAPVAATSQAVRPRCPLCWRRINEDSLRVLVAVGNEPGPDGSSRLVLRQAHRGCAHRALRQVTADD